jgi:autotransporter-associated beta strand protein
VLPANYTYTASDQGTHTFQVTFKTAGTQSLAVTDTANSSLKASANVNVTTSAQLVVLSGLGQNVTAGAAQSVTVTLTDSFGNVVTGYLGTVHLSSTDGQAGLPADYIFTAADQGKHTFQVTFKTAGTQSLAIADTSNGSLKVSANVSVNAVAQKLVLSGMSLSTVAGTQQNLTVTVTDNFGNVVTNYLGAIHFSSSDEQAALPANYIFTAGDQGKHTFALTLNTAGTQSVAIADSANANIQGSITGINVTQAQASNAVRLQITGPTNIVAGQAANFTITALDSEGRVATGYRGTIFWISSDSTTSGIRAFSFGVADQGKHTFSLTFNASGKQSLSVFDQQNGALFGALSGINVTPPTSVANSLSTLTPSQVSTGSLNALTIIVLDSQGRPVSNYQGTLHFQSSDPGALLPADYTFTAQDQGTHVFMLSLHTLGQQTVTVADLANPQGLNASLSILAVPGTRKWAGKGPDTLWSDPLNWDGGVIPQSGDTVVFNGSATQTSTTYDLGANTSLKSLVLAGSNFKIVGSTLTVTDTIDATLATGTNTIQASVNLGGKVEILGGAGKLVFAAPVNINAYTLTIDAQNSNVVLDSTLSGTGGLILTSGVLTLAGTGTNTLSGAVRVDGGTLQLNQSGGTALAGRLTIGSSQGNARSATVILMGPNQIAEGASITINATGYLNLAGQKNSLGAVTLAGGEIQTGAGILTLTGDLTASGASSILGGTVAISGSTRTLNIANGATLNVTATMAGTGALTKAGVGTLVLAGNNSYAGTITVAAGTLLLNGSLLDSEAIVRTDAAIGGSGQLGSLYLQGGSYQPGPGTGTLTVQGGATLVNGSLFTANLTPSGSNELVSSGQIALTGSVLKLSLNYQPPSGAIFTIASAAQGIVGTFAGLPEGALIPIDGVTMRITYKGGVSGNDVVLTVL